MCMLWKCIVSARNHCEVDRQRSSTQDLRNAIIHLAGRRRPWITGTGVAATVLSPLQTLAGSLQRPESSPVWDIYVPLLALYFSPLRLPTSATTRCDRRPGARASHCDENNHHVSKDCIARSKVLRDLRRYILTFTGSGGQWVSERDG